MTHAVNEYIARPHDVRETRKLSESDDRLHALHGLITMVDFTYNDLPDPLIRSLGGAGDELADRYLDRIKKPARVIRSTRGMGS